MRVYQGEDETRSAVEEGACATCKGNGWLFATKWKCPACDGSGKAIEVQPDPPPPPATYIATMGAEVIDEAPRLDRIVSRVTGTFKLDDMAVWMDDGETLRLVAVIRPGHNGTSKVTYMDEVPHGGKGGNNDVPA